MKKIIWLVAATGLATYLYKRYSKPKGLRKVEDAADNAYHKMNHYINCVERKIESILN